MQITFLVGNGFDISCGLKTSYKDFYNWYTVQDSRTEQIRAFKKEIQEDIKGAGDTWADFELGLGKYTARFTAESADVFAEIYEDARENMLAYLKNEQSIFDNESELVQNYDDFRDGILHFYKELTPDEIDEFKHLFEQDQPRDTVVKFISFNYTILIDLCISEIANAPLLTWQHGGNRRLYIHPDVLHIHGYLDHYPILGVCEECQLSNKELLGAQGFPEIMLKPNSVQAIGEHYYKDAEKEIQNSTIICIWGMSLGETDSYWWSKIIKWLFSDGTHQLIVFWYSSNPPSRVSIYRYVREKQSIIDTLTKYSSLSEKDIQIIQKRIHIVYNTDSVLRASLTKKELSIV